MTDHLDPRTVKARATLKMRLASAERAARYWKAQAERPDDDKLRRKIKALEMQVQRQRDLARKWQGKAAYWQDLKNQWEVRWREAVIRWRKQAEPPTLRRTA